MLFTYASARVSHRAWFVVILQTYNYTKLLFFIANVSDVCVCGGNLCLRCAFCWVFFGLVLIVDCVRARLSFGTLTITKLIKNYMPQ